MMILVIFFIIIISFFIFLTKQPVKYSWEDFSKKNVSSSPTAFEIAGGCLYVRNFFKKEDFKKMIILKNKTYQDKLNLDPSEGMQEEIKNIKKEKEGIFTRIYQSFYPGQSAGGLSTRRKKKRRPKFHQVRSYKQRPKQHRLK